jgi:hypothetical protein
MTQWAMKGATPPAPLPLAMPNQRSERGGQHLSLGSLLVTLRKHHERSGVRH